MATAFCSNHRETILGKLRVSMMRWLNLLWGSILHFASPTHVTPNTRHDFSYSSCCCSSSCCCCFYRSRSFPGRKIVRNARCKPERCKFQFSLLPTKVQIKILTQKMKCQNSGLACSWSFWLDSPHCNKCTNVWCPKKLPNHRLVTLVEMPRTLKHALKLIFIWSTSPCVWICI